MVTVPSLDHSAGLGKENGKSEALGNFGYLITYDGEPKGNVRSGSPATHSNAQRFVVPHAMHTQQPDNNQTGKNEPAVKTVKIKPVVAFIRFF